MATTMSLALRCRASFFAIWLLVACLPMLVPDCCLAAGSVSESFPLVDSGSSRPIAIPADAALSSKLAAEELADFTEIGEWISGARRYFLQKFEDSGEIIQDGLSAVSKEEMEQFAEAVRPYVSEVSLRGVY